MNCCFTFDIRSRQAIGQPDDRTFVFCPLHHIDTALLSASIRERIANAGEIANLNLLVPRNAASDVFKLRSDKDFLNMLPSRISSDVGRKFRQFTYDDRGAISEVVDGKSFQPISPEEAGRIRTQGLLTLAAAYLKDLKRSPQLHYEKPSGEHTDSFLRAADVLVAGPEISFISMWLLPFITYQTKHIFCDTSSISSVVMSALLIRSQMVPQFSPPLVSSFASYDGIRKLQFPPGESSLFVLSCTTSGGLPKIICEELGVATEQVVTLFFLQENKPIGNVLVNLTYETAPDGTRFAPTLNFEGKDCKLCRQGSVPIRIVGDQFIPDTAKVSCVIPSKADVPNWVPEFMDEFAGTGAVSCHYGFTSATLTRHLFIDTEYVLTNASGRFDNFNRRLDQLISIAVPAGIQRIIYFDDPSSRMLGERVLAHYARCGNDFLRLMIKSDLEVRQFDAAQVLHHGSTVVCSGAIVSGQHLCNLNLNLRELQTNGAVVFLVALSRAENKESYERIKSNLTYGGYLTASDHRFYDVSRIFVPLLSSSVGSAWDLEVETLKLIRDTFSSLEDFPPDFDRRISQLNGASDINVRGLRSDAFWPSSIGKQLVLRRQFALWSYDYSSRNLSQADVYFVVASMLHQMRQSGGKIANDIHRRVVIDPETFTRFNDGIVQAAILRAALPAELDYSHAPDLSRKMSEFLTSLARNFSNDIGEALPEFLIAMACQRLRLCATDLSQIHTNLSDLQWPRACHYLLIFATSRNGASLSESSSKESKSEPTLI